MNSLFIRGILDNQTVLSFCALETKDSNLRTMLGIVVESPDSVIISGSQLWTLWFSCP